MHTRKRARTESFAALPLSSVPSPVSSVETVSFCVPSPVSTGDDDDDDTLFVRRDYLSDDMRRVHPEVSQCETARERTLHLHRCDDLAYDAIASVYPRLRPTHHRCR